MERIVTVITDLLAEQVEAGISAFQIFDSCAGALGPRDYAKFVAPYNAQLIEAGRKTGVPIIYFSTGTGAILDHIAALGSDVISVDWRIRLSAAWEVVSADQAIQGNLDPAVLLGPWREVRGHTDDIL